VTISLDKVIDPGPTGRAPLGCERGSPCDGNAGDQDQLAAVYPTSRMVVKSAFYTAMRLALHLRRLLLSRLADLVSTTKMVGFAHSAAVSADLELLAAPPAAGHRRCPPASGCCSHAPPTPSASS
jgi:hypothetical protein